MLSPQLYMFSASVSLFLILLSTFHTGVRLDMNCPWLYSRGWGRMSEVGWVVREEWAELGGYLSPLERKHESPAQIQRSPVSAS